jgi:CheY-like chemotaxis protein
MCLKLLKMGLRRSPYPVTIREAKDGGVSLSIFADFRPNLVLTDVSMPVMDGITAAGHMRLLARPDATEPPWWVFRIYALTGLGLSDPRMKCDGLTGEASLDGWLIKGQNDMKAINQILADLDVDNLDQLVDWNDN